MSNRVKSWWRQGIMNENAYHLLINTDVPQQFAILRMFTQNCPLTSLYFCLWFASHSWTILITKFLKIALQPTTRFVQWKCQNSFGPDTHFFVHRNIFAAITRVSIDFLTIIRLTLMPNNLISTLISKSFGKTHFTG